MLLQTGILEAALELSLVALSLVLGVLLPGL